MSLEQSVSLERGRWIRKLPRTGAFVLSSILSTGALHCGTAPGPSSSADATGRRAWSRVEIDNLARRLDSLRTAARIPGLSLAIVEGGSVVLARGYGFADIGRAIAATEDTPYNIASVSKPISAVVALRLAEQGLLDLDRPMASFKGFPEFCRESRAEGGIFFQDYDCEVPTLTLRRVLAMTGNGVPGTRFFYNPPAYSWASRPMAEVAGAPFSSLVSRYVFEPAGMKRSARIHRRLPLARELAEMLATPYHIDSEGRTAVSDPPPPQGDGAAGGVVSTASDLARFDVSLDAGKLIDAASRQAMWTAERSSDGHLFPYGLGWFVRDVRGERLVWHTGLWDGAYSALYVKVPDRGVSLILLANSEGLRYPTPLDEARIEASPFAMALLDSLRR